RLPDSRARRAIAAPADPIHALPSARTPADATASRNIRVPWGVPLAVVLVVVVWAQPAEITCPGCGGIMALRRNSASHPCLRAGDDLHRDTEHPADENQPGPGDVRLLAQDDDADREEGRQRRKEGADRGQE